MAFSSVHCSVCNYSFLKDNRHINENKKLGHKFYCSLKCQSISKNKQVEFICENSKCHKTFKRSFKDISFRNFCSQACYGTLVTLRNKSKAKSFKYCLSCGNRIEGKFIYCSPKCWGLKHKLSKDKLIKELKKLAQRLGRSPTRRECSFDKPCFRQFGSWNNALIAAGLTPNRSLNQRMYKRRKCVANDGHICNSVSELIIDNWLYKNKIVHQKEVSYPVGKFTADWSLSQNILVEYFGLANDSRRYDAEIKKKKEICSQRGINLIGIYSQDLFPKSKLEQLFQTVSK